MLVETTRTRIDWFLKMFARVGLEDAAETWLRELYPSKRVHRVVALMPADAWRVLSEVALDEVYGVRGFRRPRTKAYKVAATQEVVTALNVRRRHPALTGRGVFGVETTWLPAWHVGHVSFSPLYLPEHRFVALVPQLEPGGLTRWRSVEPTGPDFRAPEGYARLFQEAEHLRFAVEGQADR